MREPGIYAAMLALIAVGCDQHVACGAERCDGAQICLAPAQACVVGLETPPCRLGECTDRAGDLGCWEEYFLGDCIELPTACDGVPTCSCLDAAIMRVVGPGARCVLVDGSGWVVVDP